MKTKNSNPRRIACRARKLKVAWPAEHPGDCGRRDCKECALEMMKVCMTGVKGWGEKARRFGAKPAELFAVMLEVLSPK